MIIVNKNRDRAFFSQYVTSIQIVSYTSNEHTLFASLASDEDVELITYKTKQEAEEKMLDLIKKIAANSTLLPQDHIEYL